MSEPIREKQREETLSSIKLSTRIQNEFLGALKPGERLPSENELIAQLNVSKHTLRLALEVLVSVGMVQKIKGKGTIVLHRPVQYPIHRYTRYTETLEKCGRKAHNKVLKKIGIPAPAEVAEKLQITEGDPVILLEILGYMDGAPFSIGSTFLVFEKVYDAIRQYNGGSLHQFIFDRYGTRLKRTQSLVSAHLPSEKDCELLEIAPHVPVIQVKSLNVDERSGMPIEFVDTRFKSTAVQLSINLD